MSKIILDTARNIHFDAKNPRIANLHALGYLPVGIHSLATQVRDFELNLANCIEFPFRPKMLMGPAGENFDMLACCFSWFSVSLTNYLKLVALVELAELKQWGRHDINDPKNHKNIKAHCTDYTKELCPEIFSWRNKIAAHFAITDPFRDDNLGTLEFSAMNTITYLDPYYYAGASQWRTFGGQSDMPQWSLTESFELLAPRLWPGALLAPIPD